MIVGKLHGNFNLGAMPTPIYFLFALQVLLVTCSGNHKVKSESPNFFLSTPGAKRAQFCIGQSRTNAFA